MKLKLPVPAKIKYRGKRYDWVSNFTYKVDAQRRKSSLAKQGVKSVIVSVFDPYKVAPRIRYAVYKEHSMRGIFAK